MRLKTFLPLIQSRCRGYVVFVYILLLVVCLVSTVSGASKEITAPAILYSEGVVPIESQTGEITGPTSICIPSSAISYSITAVGGATDYVWSVPSGATITFGQGTTSILVDFSGSSVSDSVKVDVAGSSPVHYAVFVTSNSRPVPTISGANSPCKNSSNVYTTEVGKSNYSWAVSAGGTITAGGGSNNNTVTITWNTTGNQSVSVNYTDANGCTATTASSSTITVIEPTVTISGPTNLCQNGVYTFSITGGVGTINWTGSTGFNIVSGGGSSTITAKFTTTSSGYPLSTKNINVQFTNGNCSVTGTLIVTVFPSPSIQNLSSIPTPCVGDIVTYTTEPSQLNYLWTIPSGGGTIVGGGTTSDNYVNVLWNASASKSVKIIYTSSLGCTINANGNTSSFTVNPAPTPAITGPSSLCAAPSLGNSYSTAGSNTCYDWTISSNGTLTSGGNGTVVSESFENGGNIPSNWTLEVVSGGTATSFVTTTSSPSGYSASDGQYMVRFNSTAFSAPFQNRLILNTPISTVGVSNFSIDFDWFESGTYAVTNDRMVVQYRTSPTGTWTTSTGANYTRYNAVTGWKKKYHQLVSAAQGQSQVYIALLFVSAGYYDCYLDNVHLTFPVNSATINWNTIGAQSLSVNYSTSFGCRAATPTTLPVNVYPLPIPTITGPTSACQNVSGQTYATESGKSNYVWTVSSGGTITSGGGSSNNSVTITWTTTGSKTVSVSYTENGCTAASPTVKNVTVNALPVPTIVSGPTSVCVNSTGNTYTTQPGKSSYSWSVSSGGTITAGGGSSDDYVTVSWNSVGSKTVSVNYLDVNGCTAVAPATYAVTVNGLPTPTISGPNLVCGLPSVGNHYTTEAGKTGYTWSVSSGGIITSGDNNNEITVTWSSEGTKTVTVTYADENGCIAPSPTSYAVTVGSNPIPTLTGPESPCSGETGNVYVTNGGKSNYIWSVTEHGLITAGGGNSDSTITITWLSIGDDTVSVSYTDPSGCSALSPTIRVVYTRPPVSEVYFTKGGTSLCQDSPDELYTAEAANSTSMSYSVTPASAGSINPVSGVMNWSASFSGVAHITATATGCLGPKSVTLDVTIHPKPTPGLIEHN